MFLEISLFFGAIFLGVIIGTFTGLVPGIHINLVAFFLLSIISFLSNIPPLYFAIFIVSVAITHTFIDFIPSIFLGAPEEDTYLSILPGHEMLMEGKGQEAIIITLYGSLIAIPIILLLTPFIIYFSAGIESKVFIFIPFILIFVSLYMTLREKKAISAIVVFILAGFLGFATLNLPVKEPLLPLLTGLFGASSIITSIGSNEKIKKQKIVPLKKIIVPLKEIKFSILSSLITSPIFAFLPAMGSGYAALISSEIIKHSRKSFLFLTGSLNTIVMGLSFILIYSIGKSRTGAANAVSEILKEISLKHISFILLSILVSSVIAFIIGIYLAKKFSLIINKISYRKLSLTILCILTLIVLLFSNLLGLVVFITSTALGIFCITSGARRVNMMGSLIIPTILIYLF